MSSDLDTLIDMGFERPKAELAVKKTGGRKIPKAKDYAVFMHTDADSH